MNLSFVGIFLYMIFEDIILIPDSYGNNLIVLNCITCSLADTLFKQMKNNTIEIYDKSSPR